MDDGLTWASCNENTSRVQDWVHARKGFAESPKTINSMSLRHLFCIGK